MKRSDILISVIIAEIDAWLALAIFESIGFDLKEFLRNLKAEAFFPILKWIFNYLPITLPLLGVLFILFFSLFKRKVSWLFQFGKYVVVGSLNTLIDLSFLNLLMSLFVITSGWHFSLFKAISFSVAVTNSYFWNKFWTFGHRERKVGVREYSYFFSLTVGGLLVNVGLASFLVNAIGPQFGLSPKIWANLSAFIPILLAGFWNFTSYKLIVFKK
jgi:putative flippase GtrA